MTVIVLHIHCFQWERFSVRAAPPDILAYVFVPLHCETLDDGTAERGRYTVSIIDNDPGV